MTWQRQISALKRQLAGKSKHAIARRKKARVRALARTLLNEPVIVRGEVSAAFLEKMRAMGVRVEVKS
jgi:hypothetical protein